MAILDSKGRLFGKFSLLDVGAGLIILMVVAGLFCCPVVLALRWRKLVPLPNRWKLM